MFRFSSVLCSDFLLQRHVETSDSRSSHVYLQKYVHIASSRFLVFLISTHGGTQHADATFESLQHG